MDPATKAKFVLALHKHSLQALADGGTALGGPTASGVTASGDTGSHGLFGAIGDFLGTTNNYKPTAAATQGGTNAAQLNNAYSGAQSGIAGQQQFANQAAAQNGFGNQSNVFSQQQALANQLQNQANGQGPNPAQAALNQSTGQNIAAQAALMAGQRGASANPGLIARQAAMQGAATQQQAVGQSATLQAQQQLAAQAALANQQAQLQNVAGNQIAAQGQGANAYSGSQQGEQGILQNANSNYNGQLINQQNALNTINSGIAGANASAASGLFSDAMGGLSSAAGLLGGSKSPTAGASPMAGEPIQMSGISYAAHGGTIPMGPVSHAARWLKGDAHNMKSGGQVPGVAKVPHDSLKNDTAPAMLTPGEVVIDLNTLKDKGKLGDAARFVQAALNKRKMGTK